jgi:TPR repeat protein
MLKRLMGVGVAVSLLLAMTPLGSAEQPKAPYVLYEAQVAYERGDYAEAMRLLWPLAEQGDATAQFNLGLMYNDGQGVPQDYAEAVRWHRLSAAQGHVGAQNNLGKMYAEGQGVRQDYAEARRLFRLSAEQGNP